ILPEYPEDLSAKAEAELKKMGVDVLSNSKVTSVQADAVFVGDHPIKTETALWAAGIEASSLGQSLGVPLDHKGRVLVESDLSIPGHPEVFVIGDLAAVCNEDGKHVPGVAPAAIQAGRHEAENIRLASWGKPSMHLRYIDIEILVVNGHVLY